MLFKEVKDRAVVIEEDFCDVEQAEIDVAHLVWDVLVAIATGRCEGASPSDFARVAVETELFVREPHNLYHWHVGVRELLAGKEPAPAAAPPTPPKPKPKKRPPAAKKAAKKKPPRTRPKKRG